MGEADGREAAEGPGEVERPGTEEEVSGRRGLSAWWGARERGCGGDLPAPFGESRCEMGDV